MTAAAEVIAEKPKEDVLPRGVRNCNPGNLEHGDPWSGLAEKQTDPRFCTFVSNAWGFRAIAVILCTYQDKHGITNIRGAISRWAPPGENDTEAYIAAVAGATKFGPDDKIDFHDYNMAYTIIRAIAIHENGSFEKYFKKSELDVGCIKAGLENAPRGIAGSVLKTGATVTAAAAGYAASDPVGTLGMFSSIRPILDAAPHVLQTGFWVLAGGMVVAVLIGEVNRIRGRKG
jgi:hypothetical protein